MNSLLSKPFEVAQFLEFLYDLRCNCSSFKDSRKDVEMIEDENLINIVVRGIHSLKAKPLLIN